MRLRALLILILLMPWLMGDGPLHPTVFPTFKYTLVGTVLDPAERPVEGSLLWFEYAAQVTDTTSAFFRNARKTVAQSGADGRFVLIDSSMWGADSLRVRILTGSDTALGPVLHVTSAKQTNISHDEPGCMSMTYKVVTAEIYNFPDTTITLPR